MENKFNLLTYQCEDGSIPLKIWLSKLKDREAYQRVIRRIQRMALGNFGDYKGVGDGLLELRIDYGPGYRIYYNQRGKEIILLLCAGDKRKQSADIERAKVYKEDFERRNL